MKTIGGECFKEKYGVDKPKTLDEQKPIICKDPKPGDKWKEVIYFLNHIELPCDIHYR